MILTIEHEPFMRFCFPRADGVQADTGWGRRPLSDRQQKVYNLAKEGWTPRAISRRMGISMPAVHDALVKIKTNGWRL